jgi:hypothetical protein
MQQWNSMSTATKIQTTQIQIQTKGTVHLATRLFLYFPLICVYMCSHALMSRFLKRLCVFLHVSAGPYLQ